MIKATVIKIETLFTQALNVKWLKHTAAASALATDLNANFRKVFGLGKKKKNKTLCMDSMNQFFSLFSFV